MSERPHAIDAIELRPATEADDPAVLQLMQSSLGWMPDESHAAFLHWKHRQNPFGSSPAWVAVHEGEVVGYRTFLLWEFTEGDRVIRAARAVDTATRPSHQGKGIFTRLTLHGLDALAAEGIELVFNTPNGQSRPGYLKMGWEVVGRLPIGVRPRSWRSLMRISRARVAAELWSLPTDAGEAAADVLGDTAAISALIDSQPASSGLATRRTPAFLAWRYGFLPLAYRAVLRGSEPGDGIAIFRLRRRGPTVEIAVCDILVPGGERGATADLLRSVARIQGADHAVTLGATRRAGYVPLPRAGPVLTCHCLRQGPTPLTWELCLGDVELL